MKHICSGARLATAAVAASAWLAAAPAAAGVVFNEGHQQVGKGINLVGATGVTTITGEVDKSNVFAYFGAASPTSTLHASDGVSKIEVCNPCAPPSDYEDTWFTTLTMDVMPGWGFSDMDWALTTWEDTAGKVTFTAYDQFGELTTKIFDVDPANGKDKWHFHTIDGQLVTKLVITANDNLQLHHLEQMSAVAERIPEPGSMALIGTALLGLAATRRRKH